MKASSTTTVASHQPRGLPDQVAPGQASQGQRICEHIHGTHSTPTGTTRSSQLPAVGSPTTSRPGSARSTSSADADRPPSRCTHIADAGPTQAGLRRKSEHPQRLSALTERWVLCFSVRWSTGSRLPAALVVRRVPRP